MREKEVPMLATAKAMAEALPLTATTKTILCTI